jgi:hypothetical protein
MSTQCIENGCKRKAIFNIKGNPPIFCGPHKKDGMVNINKLCKICYNITPNYNLEGLTARYCKECKLSDMIDVNCLKCIKCKKPYPLYNKKGLKPLYCGNCKDSNMVNVKDKMCDICDEVIPSFNKPGLPPKYCKECKSSDMINVGCIRCVKCNGPQPSFNKLGLPPKYCGNCKDSNMVNVKDKMCDICNETIPVYNNPGLPPKYCKECKTSDMINVKDKMCDICNEVVPCFNIIGLPAKYCKECKTSDMVDVKNKMCDICNETIPVYNNPGLPPKYCKECKTSDMINVRDKKCIECKETIINVSRYDDHCLRCFIYKIPDNKISRNYKVKEKHIQDFIEEEFPKEFIFDKQINGGCSKKRPDAFKECGSHTVIIEVDEYQHRNYEEICENKRMMEIYGDTAYRPIVFIRFNPDGYIDKDNKKIESSFNMHKTRDVPIIRDPIEWQGRLDKLKETIEHHIDTIPEIAVTNIKLFYDKN